MRALSLIENAPYEPGTRQVVFQAFDKAWSEMAPQFQGSQSQIEQARTRLAYAVLMLSSEGSGDAERLKQDALHILAIACIDLRHWGAQIPS